MSHTLPPVHASKINTENISCHCNFTSTLLKNDISSSNTAFTLNDDKQQCMYSIQKDFLSLDGLMIQ
eukprot:c19666_g2_i1 orf=71-271(-)